MSRKDCLSEKVVVIAGGASGIGAETATRLAQQHASVVLADVNETGLMRKRDELLESGARVLAVTADVAQPGSWQTLLNDALREFGHIDVLVNCAGVIRPGRVESIPEDWVRRQVDVNILGTIYGTQVFVPYFRQCHGGHIIHTSSLGGVVPLPDEAVYSATKFAVRGFCLALALELHDTPIHVTVVCPDSVETVQVHHEATQGGSALSFTSRLLQPSDVAKAIVKAILHPKREVFVPKSRGLLSKVGNFSPNLVAMLYPLLKSIGERGRARYLKTLATE